jgi:tetratricopeptide (TPR) repeat protein
MEAGMNGSSLTPPMQARNPKQTRSRWATAVLAAALAGGTGISSHFDIATPARAAEPMNPDEQSALLLNSARRAYNDRNFPQAANQFREITQKFAGGKDAPAAWYGLGLSLLDGPKDYAGAAEALKQAVAAKAAPDYPQACYFYGVAVRGLAAADLKQAADKPAAQADPLKASAKAKFSDAAEQFNLCAAALADIRKNGEEAQRVAAAEWIGRARCDQADALLRAGKPKDVEAAVRSVIDDGGAARAKFHALALYHLGHARFVMKEYSTAGRALRQLAPFEQEFGPHARFLMARIHHLAGERPEAETQYKAILTGYDQFRKNAQQQLQQGGNTLPAERKAFLESLATGPMPDYVRRTGFYQAVLLSDEAKFAEAKELLVKFYMENKEHPLAGEARLRAGFCQIQSKQFPDAVVTLSPLKDDAAFGDQATWWLAKAQLAAADPAKPEAVEAAAKSAVEQMRKAADRALQLAATDPAAKARRADILLDCGDAQIQAKQFREAAGTYLVIVSENASPQRAEEAAQRQVTALHLAGDYPGSDAAALQFEQRFPKSTLLPAVWFRSAENGYLTAVAAADKPGTPKAELDRLFLAAITRYQKLVTKFPEFQYVNAARQGIALCHYKLGKFEDAIAVLTQIPDADRNGDLATVPYLQADAMIRTFPPETEDALTAAGLIQSAEQASKLMEGFAASNAKSPLAPDAMLKQGYCYERMAGLLAEKAERDKSLQTARETFEKHLKQYQNDPTAASVYLERAKTMALQGDVGGAMNELRRFDRDPLRTTPPATLASLRLASLLRSQGQAKEAADLLAKIRAEQEANLLKDPTRADQVPLLAYEHALAVKESGKPSDARKMFEEIAAKNPGKPEAVNASWRAAQCRRDELTKSLTDARLKLNQPGIRAEDAATQAKAIAEVGPGLSQAAAPLTALVDQLAAQKAPAELTQRVLYELAWCDRTAGEAEAELARQKARKEALDRIVAKLPKPPAGQTPPTILAPDVPLASIPIQPAEVQAKDRYKKLIAAGPDRPLAIRARFELAEMVADRGDYDGAIELLNAALLAGPPQDLAERVKLRLAACFLGKGDGKSAIAAAKPIFDAGKPNLPQPQAQLVGEARFIQGEAAIQLQDWKKATDLLVPFRDQDVLRNIPGVSDRALLRLGQAYAQSGQWQPSQQAFEALVQRFGQSPWTEEARFGIGFALQNQNRFDEAVSAYTEITRRTASEVAARAQVHIGMTRIAQKKYAEATTALLSVPYTYDYPEWSAAACYEAARAFKEMQKPQEAASLWKRVVDEYPNTKSAALAKAKLQEN